MPPTRLTVRRPIDLGVRTSSALTGSHQDHRPGMSPAAAFALDHPAPHATIGCACPHLQVEAARSGIACRDGNSGRCDQGEVDDDVTPVRTGSRPCRRLHDPCALMAITAGQWTLASSRATESEVTWHHKHHVHLSSVFPWTALLMDRLHFATKRYRPAPMPRIALYAGSFDPVTNGHLDLVRQAVAAGRPAGARDRHPSRQDAAVHGRGAARHARGDLRAARARGQAASSLASPLRISSSRAAQREGATLLIRGLRNGTDFDYEMQMAGMNGAMAPDVQTVFLPASPIVRPITATLVRQIASMGGDVSPFVPAIGRRPAEAEIRRSEQALSISNEGALMIRAARTSWPRWSARCACPGAAAAGGVDPQNTLLIDTKQGRIVIKLRNDIAPNMPSASSSLRARSSTTTCRSTA